MEKNNLPKLVSEIGCNHQGSLDLAIRCIEEAAKSGADYVKFQKRSIESYAVYKKVPHPNPKHSFGSDYFEHRAALEFTLEQHQILKRACEDFGVKYAVSVWDTESLQGILKIRPEYIKIPSAENRNRSLMVQSIRSGLPTHISLGMTTWDQKKEIFEFLISQAKQENFTIYACTSSYPTKVEDLYLGEIAQIQEEFPGFQLGFSGHYLGIHLDSVAYALGANWIERHFTLDRAWKGTDQAFSLLPGELAQLKSNLKDAYLATRRRPSELLTSELDAWQKLKRGRDLEKFVQ